MTDDTEVLVHSAGPPVVGGALRRPFPNARTGCGEVFAMVKDDVLWITRAITSNPKLVTCDECRASDDWTSFQRVRGALPAPRVWRAHGPCVVSAGNELIAIVPGSTETTAAELAGFPEILRLLKQIANGEVDGQAEAAAILSAMRPRIEDYPPAPTGRPVEMRGDVRGAQVLKANSAGGEIVVTAARPDPTIRDGIVEVASASGPVPPPTAHDDEITERTEVRPRRPVADDPRRTSSG